MLHKRYILPFIIIVSYLFHGANTTLAIQPPAANHRILQSASELDYPPFAIVRADGSADGFSVDLLKAVAKASGVDIKFKVGPWHEIKQQLAEGRIDVLPLVSYSKERDKIFDFTAPYMEARGAIFVRKGETSIHGESDLRGKEVLVMRADTAHEYAVSKHLSDKLILTDSFNEAMRLLSSGKHDAVICQYVVGMQIIKKLGISNVVSRSTVEEVSMKPLKVPQSGFSQKFSFAVREGDSETLALLNGGFVTIMADGTYDLLYKKWISPILPPPHIPTAMRIESVLQIVVPTILLLAILWVFLLRQQVACKTERLSTEIEERKKAQAALAKNEERFRLLYENAPLPYQSLDYNGKIVDVNNAWLAVMGGYSKAEVVGKSFGDFLLPDWKKHFEYNFPRFREKGEVLGVEFEMVKRDGSVMMARFSGKIALENSGDFKQTHCIFQDITALKEAEEELLNKQKIMEMVFNAVPGIICLKDGDGRWLLANNYDLKLFQLEGVDYQGKTDAELAPYSEFYHDALLACMDSDNKAWEGGAPMRSEKVILCPDGFIKIFDIIKIPMFDADGAKHRLLVVGHDITERRANEEKIHQGKKEWEETFDAIPDIITLQDKDMKIIRANKAFYDVFQAKPGELIGKKCYEVFRGSNQPCANCPEISTLQGKIGENVNIKHENLGKIFQVASSSVRNENGEVIRLVHVAKDVTAQEKMAEDLFQAHKMEAIGTLAGGIAHDFNNILAVVLGYSDMVKEALAEGSSEREDIVRVIEAANRARELVRQILTFSRKGKDEQEPLLPTPIIKETIKLLRSSLPTTIEIRDDISPDCGTIIANPVNINQVILNLCTNAMHAMEDEKGILTVQLHAVQLSEQDVGVGADVSAGTFVELLVSDTGCGMDKITMGHIFEPYFTTKDIGKGTGMGLALVHGIVVGCGGFIKVQSEPGKGTTFHLYFPVVKEEKIVELVAEQLTPFPRGKERILAVDDDEAIKDIYLQTLEKLGYEITVFSSSEELLKEFESSPDSIDLIITDQTMPKLSGAELAKKILQIKAAIPIILCTGYSTMISKEKAEGIGITKFLLKPVSRRELAVAVREVLDNK